MRGAVVGVLTLISLGACQGPNERAGQDKDQADAASNGHNVSGEGPNQRLGKAQDRVEAADRKAREASASALERRGDQLRGQADVEADRLDKEARAIRDGKK